MLKYHAPRLLAALVYYQYLNIEFRRWRHIRFFIYAVVKFRKRLHDTYRVKEHLRAARDKWQCLFAMHCN